MKTTLTLAALGLAAAPMLVQAQSTGSQYESSGSMSSGGANLTQSEARMEADQPSANLDRPSPVTRNDVTYVCGGVGDEEQRYMKEQAKAYDMMLTFATKKGTYVADVDVDIKDAKGNDVLQANCDGPMMLIDLPRGGAYRVRAEAAGYSQNRTVRVASARNNKQRIASAVLTFPQQLAEGPAVEPTSSGSSGGNRGAGMSEGGNTQQPQQEQQQPDAAGSGAR